MKHIIAMTIGLGLALLVPLSMVYAPPLAWSGRAALMGWVAPEDASVERVEALAVAAGARWGVDSDLLMANLAIESGGDPNARGYKNSGAWGIAQIKSSTWDQYGCEGWPNQVAPSVSCMAEILAERIDECGSETAGIASYQDATSECPPIKESRALRVMDAKYKRILERG